MANVTVRSQLYVLGNIPLFLPDMSTTATPKAGANNFSRIREYDVVEPEDVCETHSGYGPELQDDTSRLNTAVSRVNLSREVIGIEGDVRRFFFKYITGIVILACRELQERSEVGPIEPTNSLTTVDARLSYANKQVAIVELKRPGVVNTDAWEQKLGTASQRNLGKELRMSVPS